ncbi:MAG: apolipoprotein N-acyltransferase, partial [Bacteroidota bacterium]
LLRLWQEQPARATLVMRSALILLVVALPIGWSSYRYHHYTETENPVNVVVIQPNIDPYRDKFDGLPPEKQVSRILELASREVDAETDYLVGPETALPSSLWEDHLEQFPVFRQLVDYRERYPRLNVVIGMSSVIGYDHPATATARKFKKREGWYDHFNTAMHLDSSDKVALYHKSKLVPGVERMPYPALFKPLQDMAIDLGGTSGSMGTQQEREVFFSARNNMGVAPVICYESIFGDYVGEYLRNGAELIFIITNDGWWEDTPGYRQHLAYARLRAIEGRRSIARSANTGISCFINQRGDVQQATSWWEPDVIKATINANDTLTFYTRHGDYLARIALWFGGLLMLWATVRKFVRQRKS